MQVESIPPASVNRPRMVLEQVKLSQTDSRCSDQIFSMDFDATALGTVVRRVIMELTWMMVAKHDVGGCKEELVEALNETKLVETAVGTETFAEKRTWMMRCQWTLSESSW
jgi:hypothetical protein